MIKILPQIYCNVPNYQFQGSDFIKQDFFIIPLIQSIQKIIKSGFVCKTWALIALRRYISDCL